MPERSVAIDKGGLPHAPDIARPMLPVASASASALRPLHRVWRAFPARERRALLTRATAIFAPRPEADPPPASGGIAVAGELSRSCDHGTAPSGVSTS
jgi:hypothetical protein